MTLLLIILGAAGVVAWRLAAPGEPARLAGGMLDAARPLTDYVARLQVATGPFRDALRARTPWAIVTPAIVAVNALVLVQVLFASGLTGDSATLTAWGGNLATRTTNGEWWRLVTATFVHGGIVHFAATLAGLLQLAKIVERLIGSVAFALVYVITGAVAGVVRIADAPLEAHVGAEGAIFGTYGLLAAIAIWDLVQRRGLRIPLVAFQSLASTASVFFVYALFTGALTSPANLIAWLVGLCSGLVLGADIGERKPDARAIAWTMTAAAALVLAAAIPFRGIVDIRPEIARVMAIEHEIVVPYQAAVERFRKGRVDGQVLTKLIDETIVPRLHAEQERVDALERVLVEHQPLVSDAQEYLRAREASWRLRAEGLRKGSMQTLREADRTERESLTMLRRLQAHPDFARTRPL